MYKKLFYVLFIISSTALAQSDKTQESLEIPKGTFVIGGSGQAQTEKVESERSGIKSETKNSSVLWGVDGGYAVVKNLIIGGTFSYSNNKEDQFSSDFLGFGVFVKGFKSLGAKTALTLRFGSSYAFGKNEFSNFNFGGNDISEFDFWAFRLSPGFTYFVSKKVALELTAGVFSYTLNKSKDLDTEVTTRRNNFEFRYNLSNVNLGVNIYL